MSALTALVPTFAADVVGIFDDNFNAVFTDARPIKAKVNESSKVMEHPVETGSTITDNTIILPVDIELSLMLPSIVYTNVYEQIKSLFKNRTLLTVATRTAQYSNMIISDMPHDEDPELFDVIALALKLKEVQFVTAQFAALPASKVADKSNASTVNRGDQKDQDANASQDSAGSLLLRGTTSVAKVFGVQP